MLTHSNACYMRSGGGGDGRWLLRLFRLEQLTASAALRGLGGRERHQVILQLYHALSAEAKEALRKRAAVYKLRVQQGDYHPLDRQAQRASDTATTAATAAPATSTMMGRHDNATTNKSARTPGKRTSAVVLRAPDVFQYFLREQRQNPSILALASADERKQKLQSIFDTLPEKARQALEQRAQEAAQRAAARRAQHQRSDGTRVASATAPAADASTRAPPAATIRKQHKRTKKKGKKGASRRSGHADGGGGKSDDVGGCSARKRGKGAPATHKLDTSHAPLPATTQGGNDGGVGDAANADGTCDSTTTHTRPLSAYARFVQAQMPVVAHRPPAERLKEVSRRWRTLDEGERAAWSQPSAATACVHDAQQQGACGRGGADSSSASDASVSRSDDSNTSDNTAPVHVTSLMTAAAAAAVHATDTVIGSSDTDNATSATRGVSSTGASATGLVEDTQATLPPATTSPVPCQATKTSECGADDKSHASSDNNTTVSTPGVVSSPLTAAR